MISDGRGTWDLPTPRSARLTLDDELLHIEMSCYGLTGDPAAFPQRLGILVRDHDAADVTGVPINTRAEQAGRWFQVTYRICRDRCE